MIIVERGRAIEKYLTHDTEGPKLNRIAVMHLHVIWLAFPSLCPGTRKDDAD